MIEFSQQSGSYSTPTPSWIEDAYASSLIQQGKQTPMNDDVRTALARVGASMQLHLTRAHTLSAVEIARMCLRETLSTLPSTCEYDEARCDLAHTLFAYSHAMASCAGRQ